MKTKAPPKQKKSESDGEVHASSGNVFADMGLPNADERMAKADLAHQIGLLIRAAGLSQTEAAKRLGVDQPKISALLRGKLKEFSTDRLMRFITALHHDVIITICDPQDENHPSVRVLIEA